MVYTPVTVTVLTMNKNKITYIAIERLKPYGYFKFPSRVSTPS